MFKRKKKEKPIKALVMGTGTLDEYDIGTIDKMKTDVKHGDYTLKPDTKKIFNERGFFGGIKQRYLFFNTLDSTVGPLEPMGLDTFDPTVAVSAEEADMDIHETATAGAVANLIPKIKGVVAGRKWIFVLMAIVIAIAAIGYLLHMKGVF